MAPETHYTKVGDVHIAYQEVLAIDSDFPLEQWSGVRPFQEDTMLKRIVENLRDAELPAQGPKGAVKE